MSITPEKLQEMTTWKHGEAQKFFEEHGYFKLTLVTAQETGESESYRAVITLTYDVMIHDIENYDKALETMNDLLEEIENDVEYSITSTQAEILDGSSDYRIVECISND